jgi:plastocyanin
MRALRLVGCAAGIVAGAGWSAFAAAAEIRGVVLYTGTLAQPSKVPVTIDQYICGKEKDAEELVLGATRGVLNAVVWLENPPSGVRWDSPLPKVEMDQKGCVFLPRVVVVPVGGTVDFLNSDRLLHNLHSQSKDNPSFSRTHSLGRTIPITFTKPEIVAITCDLHSWMRSWVVVADHPFYAVTDQAGGFTLRNVPPGKYSVRMWHEALGSATREIVVGPQEAALTFDIKARQ